jgi:hypothetical protein
MEEVKRIKQKGLFYHSPKFYNSMVTRKKRIKAFFVAAGVFSKFSKLI